MKKILCFVIAGLLAAGTAVAGTSLSGAIGGAWVFEDQNVGSAITSGLGASYRPDRVATLPSIQAMGSPSPFKFEPANFLFFTQQWFRDGAPDLNATGAGYSLFRAENFEMIGEVAGVFKGLGDQKASIGALTQMDIRFKALEKRMSFKIGGGYDGDDPMLILALAFETD